MANEFTYSGSFRYSKGTVDVSDGRGGKQVTVSGTNFIHHIQEIGTSEEALVMGDVATPGMAFFRNLDATNYVSIRAATGAANTIELKAGEFAGPFRLARTATSPYAIANTAGISLEYWIFED